MNEVVKNELILKIKCLLKKGIQKYAKNLSRNDNEVVLKIESDSNSQIPMFRIFDKKNNKSYGIVFKSLISFTDEIIFNGMGAIVGFNVVRDCPIYIKNFMVRACKDENINIADAVFDISICEKQIVRAEMLFNKTKKQITLDYILEK